MIIMSEQRSIREILHLVVADLAPEELGDLDVLIDDYAANPAAAERSTRIKQGPNASGAEIAIALLGQVAIGVAVELSADLARDAARQGKGRLHSLLSRLRSKPAGPSEASNPDAPVVPLPPTDVSSTHTAAIRSAIRRGATPQQARTVADAVISAWPAPR